MGDLRADSTFDDVFDGTRLIQRGDGGPIVERLQRALVAAGYPLRRFGADGDFGGETASAVRAFQRDAGLDADGIVGPETIRALDDRIAGSGGGRETPATGGDVSATSVTVGIWVDDAPARVTTEDYVATLAEHGITRAAVMVNRSNTRTGSDGWRQRWSKSQLATARELFDEEGIDIVLTAWPRPDRDQIDTMCAALGPLADACQPVALEVDVEGNWKNTFRNGFATLGDAGEYLTQELRDVAVPRGARLEATTFPFHAEFSPGKATVAERVDAVVPQAYSVSRRRGGRVDWAGPFGPGRMQQFAVDRARGVNPNVVCGLAAYRQKWDGHSVEEAMDAAFEGAVDAGCDEVRYWSSKWVVGSQARRNRAVSDYLKARARTTISP